MKRDQGVGAKISSIATARGKKPAADAPAGPGPVETLITAACAPYAGNWRAGLVVRMARELDQSSSSVAATVTQIERMMEQLEKDGTGGSGSDGLPKWAGSR